MQLSVLIFVILFTFAKSHDEWDNYKENFGLEFTLKDEVTRFEGFMHNLNRLKEHNANPKNSWKMAENKFFHLRFDEFSKKFCGTVLPARLKNLVRKKRENNRQFPTRTTPERPSRFTTMRVSRPTFPAFSLAFTTTKRTTTTRTTTTTTTTQKPTNYPFGSFDASSAPKSTNFSQFMQKIQDQGGCGSCWAFAAMAQQGTFIEWKKNNGF